MSARAGSNSDASEIVFGFDELFFSRTDSSGIIQFGNSVFQRVSIYEWDELLQKPHKVIRHPDTPRGAFRLLWDSIKAGAPFGAYVKNRAKDGRFYWVFAIVTPVEGGYLSVRLRPSSDLLAVLKTEYSALAERERRENLAPVDSAALLLDRLHALGFRDYQSFMATALGRELSALDAHLGRPRYKPIEFFQRLQEAAQTLLIQAEIIADAHINNENVPLNFRVLAAQLGQEGAAIGVISANYALLTAEIQTILESFTTAAKDVFQTINEGYFLACTARVQQEVLVLFQAESAGAGAAHETSLLSHQRALYTAKAEAGLRDITRKAKHFRQACLDMERLTAALEVTRVMGKVECARHRVAQDRMDELLARLQDFQNTTAAALRKLDEINQHIASEASELLAQAKDAA
ncbi:MAG: PAS domain-containing protein [Caulobacterales bacterium]|jgi:aerotaxis receptor|nr:PAS domain-containing protein [Caulobacterales bacterium]